MVTFKYPIGDWGKNTLVQGVNIHRLSKTRIGHRAADVAGQNFQNIVFHQEDETGREIGTVVVTNGGHGSSTGCEDYDANIVRMWFGHDGLGTSGYVQFDIGWSGKARFVPMDLPEGDIEIDNDNNRLILRNGNRYRLYDFASVKANNRIKLADFTIEKWGLRWQGMYLCEGRLFVHRDFKTKGPSNAQMFNLLGSLPQDGSPIRPTDEWNTTNMGDEAEGFISYKVGNNEVVYVVKRTGPSGSKRYIEGTSIITLPKRNEPWDGKSFPGADAFSIGSRHPAVKLLGERLETHGWTGYKNGPGVPMSETDKAGVKWWQEKQGWTGSGADGVPGRLTWSTLMDAPKPVTPKPEPEVPTVPTIPAYFPSANRTAQWYPSIVGGATFTKVDKLILHTTEGENWFNYADVGFGPHLTYKPETREWRQHIPLTKSATALLNDGSYKTNQANCIQIEIIGYAKNARLWSSDTINDLAALIRWLSNYGLLIQAPKAFTPYPPGANVKMSQATYKAARGVVGHQHVPGNNHGDPGDPPIDLILKAAVGEVPPPTTKPPVVVNPTPGFDVLKFPGASAFVIGSPHPAVKILGERLEAHGWKYKVGPGIPMGTADLKGTQWFQGLQGWNGDDADGVPGPTTWARLLSPPALRLVPPPNGAPIFGKVTTGFKVKGGWKWSEGHPGEDWNGEDPDFGEPTFAVRSGVVKYVGKLPWDQKSGNSYGDRALVIQDDTSTAQTLYAHLSAVNVRVGQRVQVGDRVGSIGFSGNVIPANKSGSHVHIERRKSPYRYGTDVVKPVYGD